MGIGNKVDTILDEPRRLALWICLVAGLMTAVAGILSVCTSEQRHHNLVGWVGTAVTLVSLATAVVIMLLQDKSQRLFERKVLGSITSFDVFVDTAASLLEAAAGDKESKVHAQLYWGWLGADRQFDRKKQSALVEQHSAVAAALTARFSAGRHCWLRVLDPDPGKMNATAFDDFLKNALQYDGGGVPSTTHIRPDVMEQTVASYKLWLQYLERTVNGSTDLRVEKVASVSTLVVVVERSPPSSSVGLLLLLELDQIASNVLSGGFETHDRNMIAVLKRSIGVPAAKTATSRDPLAGSR